jgi:hypothetical protein
MMSGLGIRFFFHRGSSETFLRKITLVLRLQSPLPSLSQPLLRPQLSPAPRKMFRLVDPNFRPIRISPPVPVHQQLQLSERQQRQQRFLQLSAPQPPTQPVTMDHWFTLQQQLQQQQQVLQQQQELITQQLRMHQPLIQVCL